MVERDIADPAPMNPCHYNFSVFYAAKRAVDLNIPFPPRAPRSREGSEGDLHPGAAHELTALIRDEVNTDQLEFSEQGPEKFSSP